MYRISEICPELFYQSNIFRFYFEDLNPGVLDIETTGLNPDRSRFILGGLVVPDGESVRATQVFAESEEEEKELLRIYLSEIKDLDVIFSYNGDNFDLPFLYRRLRHHRFPEEELPSFLSFDLYRALDKHSDFRKLLPNLKQKTVETFLGLWSDRKDEISGAESVELYLRFLKTKDPAIRDIIMLHNRDDILQLSRLLKVFEKLDLHKIMFHNGFIVSNQGKKIYIKSIEMKKDSLVVSGTHTGISMDYRCYRTSHEATLSAKESKFSLRIPIRDQVLYTCIDLEEFPYDFSELEKYPGYESGYLLVSSGGETHYGEINRFIKTLLKEILKEL